ncbi:MAG: hypothetical protein M3N51_11435 [Actinomycetota bacterium]|nr:hypothetical protein [Actinomycetota bacterium]
MSDSTLDVLLEPGFLTGLRFGFLAVATLWLAGLGWQRWRGRPVPGAGLLLSGAALLALPLERLVPVSLLLALAVLALGGAVWSLLPPVPLIGLVMAAPGAWLVAFQPDMGTRWMRWFLFGAIVVAAPLVADFQRRHGDRALGSPLLALSVVGIFFTVPDTEEAAVLLGAALPFTLLAWPRPVASLGSAGSFAVVGLLAWVIALGGQARPGALVGAVASLGLLVAEPAGRWLAGKRHSLLDSLGPGVEGALVVGSAQLVLVFLTARVAGAQEGMWEASLIAGPLLIISAILTVGLQGETVQSAG